MSDPVTNVEIEDVLTSIRKLVSEETRKPPAARAPEKPGRLVLTAAQRVKDDEPAQTTPSEPVLLTQPINAVPDHPAERSIDEIPGNARLADFGEVEGAFPDIDAFDPEVEAPQAEVDTYPEPETKAPEADDDWTAEDDDWSNDDEDTADRSELNRLIEEEVSAALGLSEDDVAEDDSEYAPSGDHADQEQSLDWSDVEPDDSYDDFLDAAEDEAAETSASDESTDEATADTYWDVPDDDMHDPEPEVQTPPEPPQTLEDKVAALGRLVARDSEEFEEERDRPDADDLAAATEPMAWPDAAPFEHVEEEPVATGSNVLHAQDAWPQPQTYQSQTEPEAEPAQQQPGPTDTALQTLEEEHGPALEIDEETLRLMVVDIVRQELQGALGERITRNVRKLVRREIHRMLISQDFD